MNVTTQYAAAKALLEGLKTVVADLQAKVLQEAEQSGSDRWRTNFGTVVVGRKKPTIRIHPAKERAFTAWVEQNAPTEIEQTVRPAYRAAVLDRLMTTGSQVFDTVTGEEVPWAYVEVPTDPRYVTCPKSDEKLRAVDSARVLISDRVEAIADDLERAIE